MPLKNHEISVDEQGIAHIRVLEGAHIDSLTLQKVNERIKELTGKKKTLALIDAKHFHTFTPEATSYLKTGVIDKTRIATAVVCDKVGVRLMVDNISKVQKTKSPIRMFSSEAQARAWLLTLKNKAKKK